MKFVDSSVPLQALWETETDTKRVRFHPQGLVEPESGFHPERKRSARRNVQLAPDAGAGHRRHRILCK